MSTSLYYEQAAKPFTEETRGHVTLLQTVKQFQDTTARGPFPVHWQFHVPNSEEIEARPVNRQFHVPS